MRILLGAMVATLVACGADDGANSLVRLSDEAAGENCPAGGQRIDVGLDDGDPGGTANNGALDDAEVDQTTYVCAPEPGDVDTANTLVSVSDEPSGENCEEGGQRLDVGLDNGDGGGTADDGVLAPGEVDNSYYLCRPPGADGAEQLISVTPAAPGGACVVGGQRIDIGLDNGDGDGSTAGDGVLDEGEIDETRFVCRRAGVGKYELLPVEPNLAFARAACDDAGLDLASWSGEDDLDELLATCDIGPRTGGSPTAPSICWTRFVGGDDGGNNDPVSVYDASAMPEIPAAYWLDGTPPSPFQADRPIIVRQDLLVFLQGASPGYPVCNIPRSIPGQEVE